MSDPAALPTLAPEARFIPLHEVAGRPHIVVDGPFGEHTVLGLSHWPNGRTPPTLRADTSTEIVARYLAAEPSGEPVELVTNNHFDEDGILAAWLLLNRVTDVRLRERAVAAAHAGDFQTWSDPAAAWTALTLMAMAERPSTPFPDVLRALNQSRGYDPSGAITVALLPHVEHVIDDPERYRRLWEPRWRLVERDMALLDSEDASITELPGHDMAIVRAGHELDRLAVFPRLSAMRVIVALADGRLWLEHRYETWVDYVSRPLPPRLDLTPLVERLDAIEPHGGAWRFEGVDHPQGRLTFTDRSGRPAVSGLSGLRLAELVTDLRENPPISS